MTALKSKYDLLSKVHTTRVCSQSRTAFQYSGPRLDNTPLDLEVISTLPDSRRNHLYFDLGKRLLGVPIRPEKVPSLVSMVKVPTNIPANSKVTTMNLSEPLTPDQITFIESTHFGMDFTLVKIEEENSEATNEFFEHFDDCDYVENFHWAILPNQNELEEFF